MDESGSGIIDWASNLIKVLRDPKSALNKLPKAVLSVIEKYGANNITSITVYREGIKRFVAKALDLISQGNFTKQMAKAGFDTMYHLYCVLHLDNGVKIYTEKNERIKLEVWNNKPINAESITIKTNVRLASLFNTALAQNTNLIRYDPITANCQIYISSLLRGHHYLTPAASKFINQDASTLLTTGQKNIASTITDVAAIGKNIISGGLHLGRFGQITRD
jgi:hypothetical protein